MQRGLLPRAAREAHDGDRPQEVRQDRRRGSRRRAGGCRGARHGRRPPHGPGARAPSRSRSTRGAHQAAPATGVQGRADGIEAFAFDAYGTLFDVFSVTALCEELFPRHGDALAQRWRAKQLSTAAACAASWVGTGTSGWSPGTPSSTRRRALGLDLTLSRRDRLMEAYLTLAAFPDVRPGLEALRDRGVKLAILSNGEPRMLEGRGPQRRHRHPARHHHQRSRRSRSSGQPPRLQPRPGAARGRPVRAGLRVVERVGRRRRRLGRLTTFWIQRSAAEPPEEARLRGPSRRVGGHRPGRATASSLDET